MRLLQYALAQSACKQTLTLGKSSRMVDSFSCQFCWVYLTCMQT